MRTGPPMPVEITPSLADETEKRYTLRVSGRDMLHILTAFGISQATSPSADEQAVRDDLVRQFHAQVREEREQVG